MTTPDLDAAIHEVLVTAPRPLSVKAIKLVFAQRWPEVPFSTLDTRLRKLLQEKQIRSVGEGSQRRYAPKLNTLRQAERTV